MHDFEGLLKKYWGYQTFRPMQKDIIQSVWEGNDTLALLPTGGGKSVCFQIPALAMAGLCIVITPLIALMKDQVEQLKKRKIPAIAIYSGMHPREIDIALDNCVYGNIKFLYVSPERLKTELFIERAKRMKVCLLAVDEAHCISQWGYDFRPPYLEIAAFRTYIPNSKIIALTASATKVVEEDIQEKLGFKDGKIFKKSFTRSNLSYSCIYEENKMRKLLHILRRVQGSSIVYVRSRKRTKDIADELKKNGIRADYYHAGLSNEIRSGKQDNWIGDKTRVMVATNAFGMGIDKPNVRTVIHLDLPDTLEAYYQEAGRAGRDEKRAFAVVLFNQNDVARLRNKVSQEFPTIPYLRRVYQSLANYLKLAVGSSNLASFDFELEDFQKTFNLEPITTYYAVKKLEEEGFVQLNETFYNPSRLFIAVDNKLLYEYTIANADHDIIIKTILRMYGGELFSNFITISENEIARNTKTNLPHIIKALQLLHQKNIVIYEPRKDKPQLTFTTARFDASKLPINEKTMEERKALTIEKMEAVINYAGHLVRCRNSLILSYFGEEAKEDCGVCDNCLNKKKKVEINASYNKYKSLILEILREKSFSIEEVHEKISPPNAKDFVECLRIMVGNEEIQYLENGKIRAKDNS